MIKKRLVLAVAIGSLAIFFTASGCYKSATVDLNANLEITRDLSFAIDVLPVLQKNCAISGCHAANGIVPDLSSGKAYLSLTTSDFLDLNNPAESELYGFVSGQITPAMPLGGADPVIAATILAWIKQGAQNN